MEYPEGVLSSFVNVNSVRTHFVEAGNGDPVVLVHGAGPGASGWSGWRQTILPLAKHFHVYALDTLGFGYTDKPVRPCFRSGLGSSTCSCCSLSGLSSWPGCCSMPRRSSPHGWR